MLTRALFALALICGMAAPTAAEDAKVLALGLTDHEATQDEIEKGEALKAPHFNTPAIAYVLAANLKKGDIVEIALVNEDRSLLHNAQTLAEDQAKLLLQHINASHRDTKCKCTFQGCTEEDNNSSSVSKHIKRYHKGEELPCPAQGLSPPSQEVTDSCAWKDR